MTWRAGAFISGLLLLALVGCTGLSSNPRYFPSLLPPGDIDRTHAKPAGFGYFRDFDPAAKRLEVKPGEMALAVRGQQVLIATVYDENDKARRKRRVEWMIEGPGTIIEVDESGLFNGRGYKVDNKYAVSYTDYFEHVIDRGNDDPSDDFTIRPGQTWCVVSSAVEGLTTVTAYAPEIHDWDKNRVFTKLHFADAQCKFPTPLTARVGAEVNLTTLATRFSDAKPLEGYKVRYKVLDGPRNEIFQLASQRKQATDEVVATPDIDGKATVTLASLGANAGTNRIQIEVVKPDSNAPDGYKVIAKGETTVEWQASEVKLEISAPPSASPNRDFPIQLLANNRSGVETRELAILTTLPPELQAVSFDPQPKSQAGREIVWQLPPVAANAQRGITIMARCKQQGRVTINATLRTGEGQRSEAKRVIDIAEAQLELDITGPNLAVVGEKLIFLATIRNPGTGPAKNIRLTALADPGLQLGDSTNNGNDRFEQRIDILEPGQSRKIEIPATPKRGGQQNIRIGALADEELTAPERRVRVDVQQPNLGVDWQAPDRLYVNQEAIWKVRVRNTGSVPVTNTALKVTLPPGLKFISTSEPGQLRDRDIVYNVGTAPPREEAVYEIRAVATEVGPSRLSAVVEADPIQQKNGTYQTVDLDSKHRLSAQSDSPYEALGISALQLNLYDSADPVEVGQRVTYTIQVRNTGSSAAPGVEIKAIAPPQMRLIRVSGDSDGIINGNRVSFKPLASLKAGVVVIYTVEAEAVEAGDARFEASVESLSMKQPLRAQEPTRVLTKGNSAGPPPPVRK